MRMIHLCREAYQPDVKLKCKPYWDTPKWNSPVQFPEGVHLTERLEWYTFDLDKVTCKECLK